MGRQAKFGAALAAIMAIPAAAALWFLLGREPALPPAPSPPSAPLPAPVEPTAPAPDPQPSTLRLTSARGDVQVRRPGGAWTAASVGLVLSEQDEIRTGDDGAAALSAEGRFVVRLDPASAFRVTELTATVDRFLLEGGMARADVEPGRDFRLGASGSDAEAEVRGGGASFAMSNNGAGTVAVGASRGEVALRAAGGEVVVRAGEESLVLPGKPPAAPTPVPTSLLLKVAWPARGATNRQKLEVRGSTAPGAQLSVGGRAVHVEADGRFATVVVLREGENLLEAEARSAGGLAAESSGPPVRLDTRGAPADFETRGLWGE